MRSAMGREAAKERVDRVAALTAVRTAAVGLLVLAYVWHVMFTYVYTADILRLHCALLYCLLYCAFLLSVPSWRTIRVYAQYSECLSGLSPPYAYPVHMCTCAHVRVPISYEHGSPHTVVSHSLLTLLPPSYRPPTAHPHYAGAGGWGTGSGGEYYNKCFTPSGRRRSGVACREASSCRRG